jgi:hypothetical protein
VLVGWVWPNPVTSPECFLTFLCNHPLYSLFIIDITIFIFFSSFSLDDKKYENENMLTKNASDAEQVQLLIKFVIC